VLLASGRAVAAAPLLDRVLAAAEAGGREGSVIEAAILLALAHAAGGDPARALDVLADALARAEPDASSASSWMPGHR
jgi:LuxR family maltose regulon positive regulatory protein